jgi:hypothetical protein
MKTILPLTLISFVLAGCASQKSSSDASSSASASSSAGTASANAGSVTTRSGGYAANMLGAGGDKSAPGSRLGKKDAEGFTVIFDGTWDGWRVNETPQSWTLVGGALRAQGERSHVFYVGPEQPFKDFELKVDVLTQPGSNGGIYIHTKYQDTGWPFGGYETQVNQTQGDWRKSGSIYSVQDVKEDVIKPIVKDNEWYTHHVVVKGGNIKIYLNGKLVNDFTEEPGRQPGKDFERKLNSGTIAFQAHDPKSVVLYKNVRIKKL